MSPLARRELRRYVQSRQKWTFADWSDAAVALACAIFVAWLVWRG